MKCAGNSAAVVGGENRKALLVDPEPAEAWRLGRALISVGFDVTYSNDGEEALSLVRKIEFELLVSDIPLPHLDGLTLIDKAMTECDRIACAIFSRSISTMVRDFCLERGVLMILDKNYGDQELCESLKTFLAIEHTIRKTATSFKRLFKEILEAAADSKGGEIVVRSEDKVGRLFFVDGKIAWAYASTDSGTLVETLQEQAGLSREELQAVYTECKVSGKNFAETLVDWKIVDSNLIRKIMLGRIAHCLSEIASWKDPKSMFVPHERVYSSTLLYDVGEIIAVMG